MWTSAHIERHLNWLRQRLMSSIGVGTVLIGLLFFLQPNFMIGAWPWKLTPLTTAVMGTMFALAGAGAISIALDARWSAVRIAFQSQMIALALVVPRTGRRGKSSRRTRSPGRVVISSKHGPTN